MSKLQNTWAPLSPRSAIDARNWECLVQPTGTNTEGMSSGKPSGRPWIGGRRTQPSPTKWVSATNLDEDGVGGDDRRCATLLGRDESARTQGEDVEGGVRNDLERFSKKGAGGRISREPKRGYPPRPSESHPPPPFGPAANPRRRGWTWPPVCSWLAARTGKARVPSCQFGWALPTPGRLVPQGNTLHGNCQSRS